MTRSIRRPVIVSVPAANSTEYQELFYRFLETKGIRLRRDFAGLSFLSVWKNRGSVDILHIHWAPASRSWRHGVFHVAHFWLTLSLCRLSKIKVIWTAHNLVPHDSTNIRLQYLKRWVLVHMADLIIVHFEGAKRQLRERFHVSEKKMIRMNIGTYEEVYPSGTDKASARKKLSIPGDKTVFLCFGAVRRYKNIESLIRAFKAADLPGAFLLIAGEVIDAEYGRELRGLVGNDERIRCDLSRISAEEVQFYFSSADCVVLPYKNIFTSGAAMLGLTFKKPILMKKCDFSSEYLLPENSILVEECDEESLARAMRTYLENRQKFTVRDEFLEPYRWPSIMDKFVSDVRRTGLLGI